MDGDLWMNRFFAFLIVVASVALFSEGASAAERYFTKEQIAGAGKHCVAGYHGTFGAAEVAVKFFAGNISDLNEQVSALGRATDPRDAPFVPKYVTKKVVLHPGRKVVSRLEQPNGGISADWSVTTWLADPGRLMEFHLQIDIWVGGGINLEDLVIPRGIEVEAGGGVPSKNRKNDSRPPAKRCPGEPRTVRRQPAPARGLFAHIELKSKLPAGTDGGVTEDPGARHQTPYCRRNPHVATVNHRADVTDWLCVTVKYDPQARSGCLRTTPSWYMADD